MAQQLLNDTQICTAVEQVGRERVSQSVRVCRFEGPVIDDPAHVSRTESSSTPIEEDRVVRCLVGCEIPATLQPGGDGLGGRSTEWNHPLLRTLAPHDDGPTREVDIVAAETAEFRNTQPTAVEQFEHRIVAEADHGVVVIDGRRGRVEQRSEFVVTQHPR